MVTPYITFAGNCNEALAFYQTAFNSKVLMSLPYGDYIPEGVIAPPINLVRISLSTWSMLSPASSDRRRAQFKKIVIMQLSLTELELASNSKRTDSSSVRQRTIRFGNLGVSNSSAILLSIKCTFALRYFQN